MHDSGYSISIDGQINAIEKVRYRKSKINNTSRKHDAFVVVCVNQGANARHTFQIPVPILSSHHLTIILLPQQSDNNYNNNHKIPNVGSL